MSKPEDTVAIGIDLGTTYSCVGVFKNGTVEIIANDQGNRTTPSYVAFTDTEKLVGDSAKNQCVSNPENTVFDTKRLIGKSFTDASVKTDMAHWPFKLKADAANKPTICVKYKGEDKEFHAEQIGSFILTNMKETAEAYLGHPVTKAVITVPAYFNDVQRQATKDAGAIAGLNVLRIINEPTAAAIAYGLGKKDGKERKVLIFDFGGGTLDVSVLNVFDEMFEVKGTSGNTHLGGEDIDNKLVDYCAKEFKKKTGKDMMDNKKAIRRLRTACERAKRTLSSSMMATIEVDSLHEGADFNTTISRAKFEELCADMFNSCLLPVEDALKVAGFSKASIDEVVLVGGSTRIPKVQQLLSNFFNGKELCKSIHPDEAVAYGAAVQAALLAGTDMGSTDILVVDSVPLTLGIAVRGNVFEPLIKRGTNIPCKKTQVFSTNSDNQSGATIAVYEGERPLVAHNNQLGVFNLEGIPPAPRGVPQIEVTYDVDANSILTVTAKDLGTGKSNNIVITSQKGRLSAEDVERMIEEAKRFEEDDKKVKDTLDAKNGVESYISNWRTTLSDDKLKGKLSDEDMKTVTDALKDASDWIDENPKATKEEYDAKQKELESLINPFATKLYGAGGGAGGMPDMSSMMGPDGKPDMAKMAEMAGMMGPDGKPDMAKMAEMMAQMKGGMGGGPAEDGSDLDEDYDPAPSKGPKVEEVD